METSILVCIGVCVLSQQQITATLLAQRGKGRVTHGVQRKHIFCIRVLRTPHQNIISKVSRSSQEQY